MENALELITNAKRPIMIVAATQIPPRIHDGLKSDPATAAANVRGDRDAQSRLPSPWYSRAPSYWVR